MAGEAHTIPITGDTITMVIMIITRGIMDTVEIITTEPSTGHPTMLEAEGLVNIIIAACQTGPHMAIPVESPAHQEAGNLVLWAMIPGIEAEVAFQIQELSDQVLPLM